MGEMVNVYYHNYEIRNQNVYTGCPIIYKYYNGNRDKRIRLLLLKSLMKEIGWKKGDKIIIYTDGIQFKLTKSNIGYSVEDKTGNYVLLIWCVSDLQYIQDTFEIQDYKIEKGSLIFQLPIKNQEPEISKEKAEEYLKNFDNPVYVEKAVNSIANAVADRMTPREINQIYDIETQPVEIKIQRDKGYLTTNGEIHIKEKKIAVLTINYNGMRKEIFNRVYELITSMKPVLMIKDGKIFSSGELSESEILVQKAEFSSQGIKIQLSTWDEVDKENSIMESSHYNTLNKSERDKYFEDGESNG